MTKDKKLLTKTSLYFVAIIFLVGYHFVNFYVINLSNVTIMVDLIFSIISIMTLALIMDDIVLFESNLPEFFKFSSLFSICLNAISLISYRTNTPDNNFMFVSICFILVFVFFILIILEFHQRNLHLKSKLIRLK